MSTSAKELILDSSVVLSATFENRRYMNRIKKLQDDLKRLKIRPPLVTPAVSQECQDGVMRIHAFLTATMRDLRHYLLGTAGEGQDEPLLTYDEYPRFLEFFQNVMKTHSPDSTEKEQLEYFETHIIRELDQAVASGESMSILNFLISVACEIERILLNMKASLDPLIAKCIPYNADSRIVESLRAQFPDVKLSDLRILAEVWDYGLKTKRECVIVTLDTADFLKNARAIRWFTTVSCCDPLYASYYARTS